MFVTFTRSFLASCFVTLCMESKFVYLKDAQRTDARMRKEIRIIAFKTYKIVFKIQEK